MGVRKGAPRDNISPHIPPTFYCDDLMRYSKAHQRQGTPLTESNSLMADRASEGALNVVPLTVVNDEAATSRSKVKQYEKNIEEFKATCDVRAVKRFWKARDVSTSQQIQMMDQMIKHRGNIANVSGCNR